MDRLFQFFRRNRLAYQGLSVLMLVLVVAAVGLLGFPVYTNFEQGRIQDKKTTQLASPQLKTKYENRQLAVGDALTRLKIPTLGVDVVVVEGTTTSALKAGAGHYRGTPLPCEQGNVAIAGTPHDLRQAVCPNGSFEDGRHDRVGDPGGHMHVRSDRSGRFAQSFYRRTVKYRHSCQHSG